MKTYPISFKAEMVRAILSGRKTETRRVIVPRSQPRIAPVSMRPWLIDGCRQLDDRGIPCWAGSHESYKMLEKWFSPPVWENDLVWVREAWATIAEDDQLKPSELYPPDHRLPSPIYYAATQSFSSPNIGRTRRSIHMPRWASRITLRVTDVGVERVQDITEEGAIAEGVEAPRGGVSEWGEPSEAVYEYLRLWNSINIKRGYGWHVNPWVWVIKFVRETQP